MSRVSPLLTMLAMLAMAAPSSSKEYLTGIEWQEPPVVDPGETEASPPSDATVLFNGKDLSAWENGENWKVENGEMVVGKGYLRTKEHFGDCQLHIEWTVPDGGDKTSQQRNNSGVFFSALPGRGGYEIQVLDSYKNKTYFDGQAGAIYKQTPPQVNAMRPPNKWNVYDIIWTGPKFNEDETLKSPAYMTALHNGVVVLNHFELKGDTPFNRAPEYKAHAEKGPIGLQDHGNPVRFRNIWVRELQPPVGKQVRDPYLR